MVKEIKNSVEELADLSDKFNDIAVPELVVRETDHSIKRQGYANLIFVPLLLAIVILNTYMLHLFFREIVPPDFVFGYSIPIQTSHVIAFLFSLLEAGIGFYFASNDTYEFKERFVSKLISSMCILTLLILAIIEFFAYLQLSVYHTTDIPLVEWWSRDLFYGKTCSRMDGNFWSCNCNGFIYFWTSEHESIFFDHEINRFRTI